MVPKPRDFSREYSIETQNSTISRGGENRFKSLSIKVKKGSCVHVKDWGYPGYLSDKECTVYVSEKETLRYFFGFVLL